MSRKLVPSFLMLAALAFAASASAHEYRFFNGSDRVYYQSYYRVFEPVAEPHIHLDRAERAFAKGHRAYAAENLEKAAAGFDYFSERAAGEDRHQLDLAQRALEKLARDVRRGEIDEVTTLARALSDARKVLAGEAVMVMPSAAPAAPAQS
jgi:Asp-tRNA(Asn)/Glu-tRNA(Gln) amidotransferase B subunit